MNTYKVTMSRLLTQYCTALVQAETKDEAIRAAELADHPHDDHWYNANVIDGCIEDIEDLGITNLNVQYRGIPSSPTSGTIIFANKSINRELND